MARIRLAAITVSAFTLLAVAFLAEGYGGRLGGRTEIKDVKTNEEVQQLGRFSVEEYNRSRTKRSGVSIGGGEVIFKEVVEAQKQVISGMKYYLKISAIQNGESKMFDTVVIVKPWLRLKQLLHFAPSKIFITEKF